MSEPLDLDALEALAEAATPGPWETWGQHGRESSSLIGVKSATRDVALTYPLGFEHDHHESDAAFIAAARTAVPALVARVRELEQEVEGLVWRNQQLTERLEQRP